MVLILLSSPNHLNPLWPATPRSVEASQLSPRTPLTPSPSFFAILSPIFTADDHVPGSPGGLLQVSPGVIPPETPPPWLLGPRSPANITRPTVSRSNSYYDVPTPNLPKAMTGDGLMPRAYQRPAFPSTTYSFTGSQAQAFRPPPPLALKRVRTEPVTLAAFSPLRQVFKKSSKPLPELKVRPPSLEQLKVSQTADSDLLQSPEAETLTVSMMGIDLEPATPMAGEMMDIQIVLEAPPSPIQANHHSMDHSTTTASTLETTPRSNSPVKHFRSPSAPVAPLSHNMSTSSMSKSPSRQDYQPMESSKRKPHRTTMSVANLQQFDIEMGCAHMKSRQELW